MNKEADQQILLIVEKKAAKKLVDRKGTKVQLLSKLK
jgi:hypothetical protein